MKRWNKRIVQIVFVVQMFISCGRCTSGSSWCYRRGPSIKRITFFKIFKEVQIQHLKQHSKYPQRQTVSLCSFPHSVFAINVQLLHFPEYEISSLWDGETCKKIYRTAEEDEGYFESWGLVSYIWSNGNLNLTCNILEYFDQISDLYMISC